MAFPIAALAGAAAGMGGGGGGVQNALTGLSTVVTSLTGKFQELINPIARLVGTFDPAIVAELNRTFQALDATVGKAFRPVVAATIDIVRSFGSAINSTMTQLQPIIAKISNTLTSTLQPVFDNLGTILESLVPIFDGLMDVVGGVLAVFGDVARALRPFIEMIIELGKQLFTSLFGSDIGGQIQDLFTSVRNAVQTFVKNLILAVASFLKLIGATQTLDALIRGVAPRKFEDIRANVAPQNAAFAGLADVAKALTLAAFTATAGGGNAPKKQEDYLAGIQDQLTAIKDGEMSMLSKQAQDMLNAMLALKGGVATVAQKVQEIYDKLPETRTLSGAEEADIDAKADRLREAGGLKQYNPGKNDSFLTQLFRS